VAVEQRVIRQSNPRSTVGTRTKIGNMLAVLFAAYGQRSPEYDDGMPLAMEMFQKNSPKGMCVKCLGSGRYVDTDEDAVIRPEIAMQDLFDGFIARHRFYRDGFRKFCAADRFH
jgi:excinuclease UvrABC ATPase subunit